MKLSFTTALAPLLLASIPALSQNIVVVFPQDGSIVTAGSQITVEVAWTATGQEDNTDVALMIGMNSCVPPNCEPPSELLGGSILYKGPFTPSQGPGMPSEQFTVTVPELSGTSMVQLNVAHLGLRGVSSQYLRPPIQQCHSEVSGLNPGNGSQISLQSIGPEMKFSLSNALAAIALEHISIASPQPGATVAPGQQITVEIDRPSFQSSSTEVSIVIGITFCGTGVCTPSDGLIGIPLHVGPFAPTNDPSEPSKPPFQNFTVAIPDGIGSGAYQLNVLHVGLVGAIASAVIDFDTPPPSLTMGKLNIAHHKSYHPYRRDNIERVRRDEEEARLKEEKEEGRMLLADSEARIELLRTRAGLDKAEKKKRPDDDMKAIASTSAIQEPVLPTTNGHINLFEDLEITAMALAAKVSKKKTPVEAEKGVALAPSAKDLNPWYSEKSKNKDSKPVEEGEEERRRREESRKYAHDPLTSITRQLASRTSDPSSSSRSSRTTRPPKAIADKPPEVQERLSRESSERERALELIRRKKREMEGNATPSTVHGEPIGGYGDVFNRREVEEAHRHRERDRRWDHGKNHRWHGPADDRGRRRQW
ncbi:hypothetical protein CVT26_003261 [Gymnopilus dilepis]|uniref:CBF1-interacting co-repressor CIR N-terminal domain-containing protein n=1 Tax=Gymnopilus dilepis TaxID=231916 RepID=A0A409Y547_9AGAR|nr:hypothetical protein CVT26_003261 [Gymnopilus dilepis]